MIITPENIARHEIIGLLTEVVESTNPCLEGIRGRVTDETRNTFLIETDDGEKRVAKSHVSFVFSLPRGRVKVAGSILVSQPENRIHKKIRKSRWKL
ncbi:MAG: ribonuclease P protein component 1 [Euryarchaeota archaeon]|nr:ribonuclease P protein component 1 [Euryarchaeota archaeon]